MRAIMFQGPICISAKAGAKPQASVKSVQRVAKVHVNKKFIHVNRGLGEPCGITAV